MNHHPVVLAITGASGSAYAVRLAQVLLRQGRDLHLIVSDAGRQVARRELGVDYPPGSASEAEWLAFFGECFQESPASEWGFRPMAAIDTKSKVTIHSQKDYSAGIASGSFLTAGMVICPCSMGTLSSIACGASTNLIQRAADVHLKERRPLVLIPRETPLGLIALENMTKVTQAGATVMPAMPGFYQYPTQIGDLVDFVVARICDHLRVEHDLMPRWGDDS